MLFAGRGQDLSFQAPNSRPLRPPPCVQISDVQAQVLLDPSASDSSKGFNLTALIAGISAAGGGLLLGIMVGLVWYRRRRATSPTVSKSGFCCCMPQGGPGGFLSQGGPPEANYRQAIEDT